MFEDTVLSPKWLLSHIARYEGDWDAVRISAKDALDTYMSADPEPGKPFAYQEYPGLDVAGPKCEQILLSVRTTLELLEWIDEDLNLTDQGRQAHITKPWDPANPPRLKVEDVRRERNRRLEEEEKRGQRPDWFPEGP